MAVHDQSWRSAARLYVSDCLRTIQLFIALTLGSACAVLLTLPPVSANATPLPVSRPQANSHSVGARSTPSQRDASKQTIGPYALFLPLIQAPQAKAGPHAGGIAIGVYQPQTDLTGAAIDQYTSQAGAKPGFAWQATTWQRRDGSYVPFDQRVLDEYRTRGIMPGLTWEPSEGPIESYADRQAAINQAEFSWQSILSGTHDAYITEFAQAAAAYQYPFVLRVLHEMDGNWYPWGYGVNGNTNVADFVSAYRHIVNLFRAAGATNVQFVWNPCVGNAALTQQYGALFQQAYPGDSYVDWVALDGYNNNLNNWRSLQDIFQPAYQLITSFTNRPMILFEVGTIENPQDPTARANWITEGFLTTVPNQFPNIKVAVWFNSEDSSGRDFALDTPDALNAWKRVVSSPSYQGTLLK